MPRLHAARLLFPLLAITVAVLGGASGTPPAAALGRADIAAICDAAAHRAASEVGIPVDVLLAITRTETGRTRKGTTQPWPWTVNMEGTGKWFDDVDAARAYVFRHFKRGARSFDVGCFQINYKWHGEAFRSIDEMFDPLANALYAARFLKRLHAEKGAWSAAAGAYHSRTPKYANRYKQRFDRFRARVAGRKAPVQVAAARVEVPRESPADATRVNTFPLLQSGGVPRLGSLFPAGAGAGQSLLRRAGG